MLGDTLRATAVEISRGNRLGLYDVTVTNQRGETVALFRGKSYRVGESLLDDGASKGK
jgi:acyl-CoA thioesterase